MSTKPHLDILYREVSIAEARESLRIALPVLREFVDFGTNALMRCTLSVEGDIFEDMTVLALYRHILEMTDAVELLLSHGSAVPARPVIRSSFEALLSIEYILESDETYCERALSWLVNHFHNSRKFLETLIPETGKGVEFAKALASDPIGPRITLPSADDARRQVSVLDQLMSDQRLRKVVEEFKLKPRAKWYSLFDGPNDLRALARHMNQLARYDHLYRIWSSTSHSLDLRPFMALSGRDEFRIGRIRETSEYQRLRNWRRLSHWMPR